VWVRFAALGGALNALRFGGLRVAANGLNFGERAMPTMTTVYRAMVMIATGAIVVMGWQHYGPSTEQVKAYAIAAMDKARAALTESSPATNPPTPLADPRTLAPPLVAGQSPVVADSSPGSPEPPKLVPLINAGEDTLYGVGETTLAAPSPLAAELEANGVAPLLARLQEMGGADAQVGPWGASGQFYRCCCQAKLAESSPMARHFEAVANEPIAAVQQVVAKVEAWRSQQQNSWR
jgi:hypothetical protein